MWFQKHMWRCINLSVRKVIDAARKLYFQMLPLLGLMEGGGKYTQWVKAACALVGRPAGAPRAPLQAATKEEIKQLEKAIALIPSAKKGR